MCSEPQAHINSTVDRKHMNRGTLPGTAQLFGPDTAALWTSGEPSRTNIEFPKEKYSNET